MSHILLVLITIITLYLFKVFKLSSLIKKSTKHLIELKNILFDKNSGSESLVDMNKMIIKIFFFNCQIILIFLMPIILVLIITNIKEDFLSFVISYISFIEIFIICIIYYVINKKIL